MTWHKAKCSDDGVLRHPADAQEWKEFEYLHETFAQDPWNVGLGLATNDSASSRGNLRQFKIASIVEQANSPPHSAYSPAPMKNHEKRVENQLDGMEPTVTEHSSHVVLDVVSHTKTNDTLRNTCQLHRPRAPTEAQMKATSADMLLIKTGKENDKLEEQAASRAEENKSTL
ncbi:hypothetical protein Salat_0218000 [Sesamum alatum]|uniref:Uncharacterized protein n=1 Tax=Sesamum alatum TaxID=300844 RepID=A0AAE1YYV4_9LAMI|nr:hypothetical protein Salat_0218000 [Sesamum alatum]